MTTITRDELREQLDHLLGFPGDEQIDDVMSLIDKYTEAQVREAEMTGLFYALGHSQKEVASRFNELKGEQLGLSQLNKDGGGDGES